MGRLAYMEDGKGIPVVLLHGFCETKEIWNETISCLSKTARVIAPDLPGFGDNPALSSSVSIDTMAEDVYDFLQDLEIKEGIVVGHSLGGYISLALAEKYPEWIQGLCLFHSTALADTEEKKEKRNKTIVALENNGIEAYAGSFIRGLFYEPDNPRLKGTIETLMEDIAGTHLSTAIEVTKAMRDRPDRTQVLKNADYPVLFIAGKEDTAVPLLTLQEQVFMPEGTVYFQALLHTAHMGMFESKEETLEILSAFVKQTGSRTGIE